MRSSRGAAGAAIFFGALAVLAIPAGILASRETTVTLVRALYAAVAASCLLGLIAVGASRRARLAFMHSIRPERRGRVRAARLVAWLGLYVGITGALALGVYAVLRLAQG
jgi:hypothetical protein